MQGSFTDQLVHIWLQDLADGSWISLHYDTPALADSNFSEIFGGGYTRQRGIWSQPTNRSIWSLNNVRFTGLTQNQITYFGIWSSQRDGQLQAYAPLPEKVLITTGNGFLIAAGELAVSIG